MVVASMVVAIIVEPLSEQVCMLVTKLRSKLFNGAGLPPIMDFLVKDKIISMIIIFTIITFVSWLVPLVLCNRKNM